MLKITVMVKYGLELQFYLIQGVGGRREVTDSGACPGGFHTLGEYVCAVGGTTDPLEVLLSPCNCCLVIINQG